MAKSAPNLEEADVQQNPNHSNDPIDYLAPNHEEGGGRHKQIVESGKDNERPRESLHITYEEALEKTSGK